jgi:hypothetical protein
MPNPLVRKLSQRDALDDEERDVLEAIPATLRRFGPGDVLVRQGGAVRITARGSSNAGQDGSSIPPMVVARSQRSTSVATSLICIRSCCGRWTTLSRRSRPASSRRFRPSGCARSPRSIPTWPDCSGSIRWSTPPSIASGRLVSPTARRLGVWRTSFASSTSALRRPAKDHAFGLPLTQTTLGEVIGTGLVHVNRTLQAIRRDGLLEWRRGSVQIKDWTGLVELADFDPGYLNLVRERR